MYYPRSVASPLPSAGVKTQTCSEDGACQIKRAPTSRRKIFLAFFFRYIKQNRMLTVTYCAKVHGPRLTANWRSGESCAAWCHARRLE